MKLNYKQENNIHIVLVEELKTNLGVMASIEMALPLDLKSLKFKKVKNIICVDVDKVLGSHIVMERIPILIGDFLINLKNYKRKHCNLIKKI